MIQKMEKDNLSTTKRAWLVTWEYAGDWETALERGFVSKKIAAILSFRKSGRVVAEFIEQLYAIENYWAFEQIYYSTRRSKNPYQPRFEIPRKVV